MLRRLLGVALVAACQVTLDAAKAKKSFAGLNLGDADAPAAAADGAPRRQASLLHVRRGGQAGKPDVSRMVATMEKLAKALEKEQDESKGLAKTRAKECRSTIAEPEKAIKKGRELIQETKENLATYKGDQQSLASTIAGVNKQITAAMSEIDSLTSQLSKLRKRQKKASASAAASLQQIDKVIAKEYRLEKDLEEHPDTTPRPTGINAEVSRLEELGSHLAYADAPADEGVAFVQTAMLSELISATSGAAHQLGVLKQDRTELVQARERAKKGFNEEEKRLIDLLKIKHEEAEKLEASLREQQPILADKLKQATETNRAKNMAERVLERDITALQMMQDKCKLMTVAAEQEAKLRFQLINLIKMPAKLLEGMDSMMFLAQDLQDLGGDARWAAGSAPSFVQVEAQTSSAELGDAMQAALRSADDQEAKQEGAVPDEAPAEQQSASTQAMQMAMQMQQQVAMVQEENGDTATGPFDKVSGMIKALMTSLRDQANEEMDLHQWCTDTAVKNKKDRLKIRAYMDETATEIHWAKSAIAQLDDQIGFFSGEVKRLEDHRVGTEKLKDVETARLTKYLSDHEHPVKNLEKVVIVLREQCQIDAKELKLIQGQANFDLFRSQANLTGVSEAGTGKAQDDPAMLVQGDVFKDATQSRRGQCLEAAKLVVEALAKFDELDKAIVKYRADFLKLSTTEVTKTADAINMRNKGLRSATSDRAKRTSDMATSENDKKQSEKDLAMIEKAKQQQEQKCQKKDTREDRIARRVEEIGALKSALKVMEGEEIPVESLAQTGSASHTVHT